MKHADMRQKTDPDGTEAASASTRSGRCYPVPEPQWVHVTTVPNDHTGDSVGRVAHEPPPARQLSSLDGPVGQTIHAVIKDAGGEWAGETSLVLVTHTGDWLVLEARNGP